jgi:hypothetical protein
MTHLYRISRHESSLNPGLSWDGAEWKDAQIAPVSNFLPQSSAHHPRVQARLLWSDSALHGIYRVEDQYVRCVRSNYFDEVWKDSCVEFFLQPCPEKGYFNFEFNCGGAFLCNYITDHRRTETGFACAERLPAELGSRVAVISSLPKIVEPELQEPTTWFLNFRIPFAVLENYVGKLNPQESSWRGNFYKCAEEVSHPHWAAWAPVPEFNFHLPNCFGELVFTPKQ